MKQNEKRQKRQNLIDEDIDSSDIASSDKIYVNSLNLHENKNQIIQDYTGDFELNG